MAASPTYEQDYAELIGPPPKRKYDAGDNRCPHIRNSGERCRRGVMSGSEKCATHSGMSNPAVVAKRREERTLAEIMEDPVVVRLINVSSTGPELDDPLSVLRKSAASVQRMVEYYTSQPGDDPGDVRLDKAMVLLDKLERTCVTLVKIGQKDRALDAAELRQLPVWIDLEDKIVAALDAFPEAKAAVFAALTNAAPQPTPVIVAGEVV